METFMTIWFWFGIPVVMIVVGCWTCRKYSSADFIGGAAGVVGAVWFLSALIVCPMMCYQSAAECQKFKATKNICENKSIMTESERCALALKATESNQWLAAAKYWRSKPLLSIYWSKEIEGLKPIGE